MIHEGQWLRIIVSIWHTIGLGPFLESIQTRWPVTNNEGEEDWRYALARDLPVLRKCDLIISERERETSKLGSAGPVLTSPEAAFPRVGSWTMVGPLKQRGLKKKTKNSCAWRAWTAHDQLLNFLFFLTIIIYEINPLEKKTDISADFLVIFGGLDATHGIIYPSNQSMLWALWTWNMFALILRPKASESNTVSLLSLLLSVTSSITIHRSRANLKHYSPLYFGVECLLYQPYKFKLSTFVAYNEPLLAIPLRAPYQPLVIIEPSLNTSYEQWSAIINKSYRWKITIVAYTYIVCKPLQSTIVNKCCLSHVIIWLVVYGHVQKRR